MSTTLATVLCLDLEKKEPYEQTIRVPRAYKNERMLLKAISDAIGSPTVKVVHVITSKIEHCKFTMTEQHYIDNADITEITN